VPVVVTENVAVCPAVRVWLAGWAVIDGGTLTVRVAGLLVIVPAVLLIVTVNCAPLSKPVEAAVV
jgi:hypothetical protein